MHLKNNFPLKQVSNTRLSCKWKLKGVMASGQHDAHLRYKRSLYLLPKQGIDLSRPSILTTISAQNELAKYIQHYTLYLFYWFSSFADFDPDYVETSLVGSGKVSQAAIIGLGGGVWACSPGFEVRIQHLLTHFNCANRIDQFHKFQLRNKILLYLGFKIWIRYGLPDWSWIIQSMSVSKPMVAQYILGRWGPWQR
jgi:hypothetical protein